MSVRLLLTGQAKLFIVRVRKYLYIDMYMYIMYMIT